MSQSEKIRIEGDKCFHRATQVDANLFPAKARNFYEQALFLFYQAKEKAEDGRDEFLAAINIGEAAWRIANVLKHEKDAPETIIFYLHEAIKGFLVAYNHPERCAQWRAEVVQKLASCYQDGHCNGRVTWKLRSKYRSGGKAVHREYCRRGSLRYQAYSGHALLLRRSTKFREWKLHKMFEANERIEPVTRRSKAL